MARPNPPSSPSSPVPGQPAQPRISPAEMEILRIVMDRQPVAVREVAEEMANRRGLARTTVLTLMERLRAKGHLKRRSVAGVNQYELRTAKTALLKSLVSDFIDTALGGSLSPLVAYLTERAQLTDRQAAELGRIVDQLQSQERAAKPKSDAEEKHP